MSGGEFGVEKRGKGAEYLRSMGLVVLGALLMFLILKYTTPLNVDYISIQYTANDESQGQSLLIVERNHEALLIDAGSEQVVRRGTFNIDRLFQELLGQLVNTWDEEKRVDQRVGVVRIGFNNKTSGTYHLYDGKYVEELIAWARTNVVDNR